MENGPVDTTNYSTEELDDYLAVELQKPHVSPQNWWRINAERFPVLAVMAWDILWIPAMLAQVERVFSGLYLQN